MQRYQEARHLGDGLTRDTVRRIAASVDAPIDHTVVVNPSADTRAGTVTLAVVGRGVLHYVADDGSPCPTQIVGTTTAQGSPRSSWARRSAGCST